MFLSEEEKMRYITYSLACKLLDHGFSIKHLEDDLDKTMVFYKDGTYFQIGGDIEAPLSPAEKELLQNATWIPTREELEWWLYTHDFSFTIVHDQDSDLVRCHDTISGTDYTQTVPSPVIFDHALAYLILKILKKHERAF